MITIKVNLDARELEGTLARVVDAMRDTTPLMQDLAQVMSEASDRAFATETDPVTGARWVRLNPDYQAQLTLLGFTGTMLQRHGLLKNSLRVEAGHLYARIGSNLRYAAIHQFGGTTRPHWIHPRDKKALAFRRHGRQYIRGKVFHPGSEIPRRRFLGVGVQEKQDMKAIILDYLRGAFDPHR